MSTFTLDGSIDDVQKPELLPNDKYALVITQEPEMRENKALRDNGADDPKAGHNIVLFTRVYDPDNPKYHGRSMNPIYLPVPKAGDDEKYNNRGMTIKDAKLERIGSIVGAFGGSVDGDQVTVTKYMMGIGNVTQTKDQEGNLVNELQVFGRNGSPAFEEYTGPRPEDMEAVFS